MHIIRNFLLIVFEIAACVGVAWAGLHYPMLFAAASALIAFGLGLALEIARLRHEWPFYFGPGSLARGALIPVAGFLEALFKGIIAGVAAIFTFSGTDPNRLFFIAVAFGLVTYLGVSVLRVLALKLDARPERWGFFRSAPVLGLAFSALIAVMALYNLVPSPSMGEIGWTIVWDMPRVPSVEQVSELIFRLKQAFDDFVVSLAARFVDPVWARLIGILISVNVLAGFVAALYASLIATLVKSVEGGG